MEPIDAARRTDAMRTGPVAVRLESFQVDAAAATVCFVPSWERPRFTTRPFAQAAWRQWAAVPVVPGRENNISYDRAVVAALGDRGRRFAERCAHTATEMLAGPLWVSEAAVLGWPVAPQRHGNHTGRHCELAESKQCWLACAATIIECAQQLAETDNADTMIVPALIASPPVSARVTHRALTAFEDRLIEALGAFASRVVFAPAPTRRSHSRAAAR